MDRFFLKQRNREILIVQCDLNYILARPDFSTKGQIMSECIYEIIDFPKYHQKILIDFCPESLFRLGTYLCYALPKTYLSTHLSRVPLRIIKTNYMYLVYNTFQGRNLSNFSSGILENRWFHKYILTLSDLYTSFNQSTTLQ